MLTSQDLAQIENLVERLLIKFEEKISNKIDERADQIIEYMNPTLDNHERRITKLEDKTTYFVRDQNKE